MSTTAKPPRCTALQPHCRRPVRAVASHYEGEWSHASRCFIICFVAAGPLLVLYIGLVIRGRLFGVRARHAGAQQELRRPDADEGGSEHPTDGGRSTVVDNPNDWPVH